MKFNRQGFTPLIGFLIIAAAVIVGGGVSVFILLNKQQSTPINYKN